MNEFLEFASAGKNSWWRYARAAVAAIVFAIIALVLVFLPLTMLHLLPPDVAVEMQHPKDAPIFFLGTAATFGALLAGLIVSIAIVQRKRPSDVIGRWRWRQFFFGLSIWTIVQCILTGIDFLIAPRGFSVTASGATATLAVFALFGLSIQSFAEEFVFRGYVTQGLLLATKRPVPAAIISGLLFGAVHIPNGLPQAANAVAFGIVCALIAIRTGGIAFTFGLHLVNNLFGAVAVVSTSDVFKGSPGILTQNTPQLLWWDVGSSILAFVALAWFVLYGRILVPPSRNKR